MEDDNIQNAANVLAALKPGFLPKSIFLQTTRLTTTPIIEIVPLRHHNTNVEILLFSRPGDDPVWPGQLHTPGTVIRATDTLESAIDRLITDELDGIAGKPTFVQPIVHHSGRGNELAQIYWLEVSGEHTNGIFYDVDQLPAHIVQSQLDFIPLAVNSYKAYLQ